MNVEVGVVNPNVVNISASSKKQAFYSWTFDAELLPWDFFPSSCTHRFNIARLFSD